MDEVRISHSVWSWLPLTMQWLERQIKAIGNVKQQVLADSQQNSRLFGYDGLQVVGLPSPDRALNKVTARLGWRRQGRAHKAAIHTFRPTILHSHFGDRGWRDLSLPVNAARIVSFYGLDVDYLPQKRAVWRKRYLELFHRAERILCLGPSMWERLTALGCPESKLLIHHVGTDVERVPFCARQYDGARPLRILIASSFRPKKGIPYGLLAVASAMRTVPVEVTLVGDADRDPRSKGEKAKIMSLIRRYRIPVRVAGFMTHDRLIRTALEHDLFLAPSVTADEGDREGTPVAIMDMMATGMPVISSWHSDIPEIIDDSVNGYLVEERDHEAIAAQIVRLADAPAAEWTRLGTNARTKIVEKFDNKRLGEELLAIYKSTNLIFS